MEKSAGTPNEKIHWADVCASEIDSTRKHTIATGITPSGPIHIGNMREVVTGDMVYKAMKEKGFDVELIYNADDFDPLRKVYPFLDQSYEKYIGHPLCDIPCPCGKHKSYAEHFLEPFLKALEELDVKPKVLRSSESYRNGVYTEYIKTVLENVAEIKAILERVSQRKLPDNWTPFTPICSKCGIISSNAEILEHDPEKHTVKYRCSCGHVGVCDYSKGEGKLAWRVDWPMRWSALGVTVEPFGKDHSAAGGSYDTGKEIAEQIFKGKAPYPVPYEWISLKGKGAMASSTGVAITITSMLEIVPPDVLRYMVARSKPEKAITFDPGLGLLTLIDEYAKIAEKADSREYELSKISNVATDIPFRHLVTVVQIAKDDDAVLDTLRRSGYTITNRDAVLRRAQRAKIWVEKYAPENVRFIIAQELPDCAKEFTDEEKAVLKDLYEKLQDLKGDDWNAANLHNAVYECGEKSGIGAKGLFTCIYKLVLGKERGPRAGWFLEALGRDFCMKRISESGF